MNFENKLETTIHKAEIDIIRLEIIIIMKTLSMAKIF